MKRLFTGPSNEDESKKRKLDELEPSLLHSLNHPVMIKTETIMLPKRPKQVTKVSSNLKGSGKNKDKIKHKLQFY